MKLVRIPMLTAACMALTACALFQAAPTPADCAKANIQYQSVQAALGGARASVAIAQSALASAQAQGASSATIQKIQADLAIAQNAASAIQTALDAAGSALAAKCPAATVPAG